VQQLAAVVMRGGGKKREEGALERLLGLINLLNDWSQLP